jgi:hypothetical protein
LYEYEYTQRNNSIEKRALGYSRTLETIHRECKRYKVPPASDKILDKSESVSGWQFPDTQKEED